MHNKPVVEGLQKYFFCAGNRADKLCQATFEMDYVEPPDRECNVLTTKNLCRWRRRPRWAVSRRAFRTTNGHSDSGLASGHAQNRATKLNCLAFQFAVLSSLLEARSEWLGSQAEGQGLSAGALTGALAVSGLPLSYCWE